MELGGFALCRWPCALPKPAINSFDEWSNYARTNSFSGSEIGHIVPGPNLIVFMPSLALYIFRGTMHRHTLTGLTLYYTVI